MECHSYGNRSHSQLEYTTPYTSLSRFTEPAAPLVQASLEFKGPICSVEYVPVRDF